MRTKFKKIAIAITAVAILLTLTLTVFADEKTVTPDKTLTIEFEGGQTDYNNIVPNAGKWLIVAEATRYSEWEEYTTEIKLHLYNGGDKTMFIGYPSDGVQYIAIETENPISVALRSDIEYWYSTWQISAYNLSPDIDTSEIERRAYNEGFDSGYAEGQSNGYASGYIDGRDEAIEDNYENYQSGYEQGRVDWYGQGYNTGREHGLAEGQELDNVFVQGMDGILTGLGGFFAPILSLGVGSMTVSALLGLLVVVTLIMIIVKVVRG